MYIKINFEMSQMDSLRQSSVKNNITNYAESCYYGSFS